MANLAPLCWCVESSVDEYRRSLKFDLKTCLVRYNRNLPQLFLMSLAALFHVGCLSDVATTTSTATAAAAAATATDDLSRWEKTISSSSDVVCCKCRRRRRRRRRKNATAKKPNYQEKWKIINQPGSLIRAANNGKSCRWRRRKSAKRTHFRDSLLPKKTKNFGTFRCRVSSVRLEGVICCRTFFPITTKQQIGKKQNFLSSY